MTMNALSPSQLQRKPNTRSRRESSISLSSKKPSRFSRLQSIQKQPLHIIHELSDEDETPRFSIASEEQALHALSPAFTMMMTPPRATVDGDDVARTKIGRRQASVMPVFRPISIEAALLGDTATCISSDGASPDCFNFSFTDNPFGSPRSPLTSPTSSKYSPTSLVFPVSPSNSEHSSSSESEVDDDVDVFTSSQSISGSSHVEPLHIVKRQRSFSRAVTSASSSQSRHAVTVVYGSDSEDELYEERSGQDDDDVDFYASEFNKILTLNPPLPASFPYAATEDARKPRPETLYVPAPASTLYKPSPSPQLDPSFSSPSPSPTRRTVNRSSLAPIVPSRPPPSPPPPKPRRRSQSSRIFSLPADFEGFVELCGDSNPSSDSENVDIFDMYPTTFISSTSSPSDVMSPASASSYYSSPTDSQPGASVLFSQGELGVPQDVELHDDEFFFCHERNPVTRSVAFSFELPVTPTMDLEAEVINGLEELRRIALPHVDAHTEAEPEALPEPEECTHQGAVEDFQQEQEAQEQDLFLNPHSDETESSEGSEPDHTLRSQWSSSTLASTYSTHYDSTSTSSLIPAKLLTYFSSPKSMHIRGRSKSSILGFARQQENRRETEAAPRSPSSPRFPYTPTSPWSFPASPKSSPTSSGVFKTPSSSPSPPRRLEKNGAACGERSSCESGSSGEDDVRSVGSDGSAEGMRRVRKPIPVEMFLRV